MLLDNGAESWSLLSNAIGNFYEKNGSREVTNAVFNNSHSANSEAAMGKRIFAATR